MKAVIFAQCGNPAEVLQLGEQPIPIPARGEVLVRMLVAPINPSDLLFIQGQYGLRPNLPATPGFEGVGIVEKTGGGLLSWLRKGKRVAVLNDRTGNWKEYTTISARQVVPLPRALSNIQAATFFVNPATAIVLTRYCLRIAKGEWLLQTAAGSNLGKMIIRLAKRDGFKTINIVRRAEQVAELKALGADEVICEKTESIVEGVKRITAGRGVCYAIDPVGGQTASAVIQTLAPGGRAILYGLLSGEAASVDPRFLITGSKKVEGFWLTDWVKSQSIPTMLGLFRQIGKLMQEGVLQSEIGKIYPLSSIQEAVTEANLPGKAGKVLLQIADIKK